MSRLMTQSFPMRPSGPLPPNMAALCWSILARRCPPIGGGRTLPSLIGVVQFSIHKNSYFPVLIQIYNQIYVPLFRLNSKYSLFQPILALAERRDSTQSSDPGSCFTPFRLVSGPTPPNTHNMFRWMIEATLYRGEGLHSVVGSIILQ